MLFSQDDTHVYMKIIKNVQICEASYQHFLQGALILSSVGPYSHEGDSQSFLTSQFPLQVPKI